MIIFGTRAYLQAVAMVNFICTNCHNPAAQRVMRRVVRFTLFFIPLFPVSSSYTTTCTFCGLTTRINKEQAESYAVYAQQQQAGYAQPQVPNFQQPAAQLNGSVEPPYPPQYPPHS